MQKFWAFKPTAGASNELDLVVYGFIEESARWDDEVGAKQFRQELDAAGFVSRINVRINSGGGDAFAGIAIHGMLKAHPAEVVVTVEGLAASAASLIAMAGDRVIMARGSMLMIHNPAALAMGEAEDLRKTADVLDKLRDGLIPIYQAKTGKTAEELTALLDAETWLTAEEAVAQGFADEVAGSVEVVARGDQVFFASVGFPRRAVPAEANAKDPEPEQEPEPEPITRETLAARSPDLLAALLDEGARAERSRLQAIDEVALPGHEALVARARYEEPITAEALALAIIRAEREHRTEHLAAVAADAHETEVDAAPLAAPTAKEEEDRAVRLIVGDGRRHR